MIEREKVIKGLEKCKRYECDDCTEKGASQAPWDCPAYDNFVDSALAMLKEQEVVVRCKDCKNWVGNGADIYELPYWLPCKGEMRRPDYFCADGERR